MKKNKPVWLRLWPYLRPYLGWVLFACAAGALRFAIPLAVPWAVKILVDDVLIKPSSPESFAELSRVLTALGLAYLVWIFASFFRMYFTGLAGNRLVFDLRLALYRHVQKMPLEFFERWKTGALVSRLLHDMSSVQQLVTNGAISAFMDLTSILLLGTLMTGLNWKLALVSFAAVPFYILLSRHFMSRIRVSSRGVQDQIEKLSGNLHEKISGMTLIQSFSSQAHEENIFSNYGRRHLDEVLKNVTLQSLALSIMGFLAALTPLAVIGYGSQLVLQKSLSVGELVAFYAYVGFLYTPLNRLMELNVVVGSALAAADRIFEIFDAKPAIEENSQPVHLAKARGKISFESVSFSYENENLILDGVNLELIPEECAALCGASGAGKSTLFKLLLRFYDAKRGVVKIDGRDIREWSLESLRAQIAWVPQEPFLFSGSILENILYGRRDASPEEAVEAARAAYAHDFILQLPQKYETPVGEKGQALSAGEKQRIAIARAFLRKAPILLMDEPSSALDERSESLINQSLKRLLPGKTALIISHRLSMMEETGRAFYLREGKILAAKKPEGFSKSAGLPTEFFKT